MLRVGLTVAGVGGVSLYPFIFFLCKKFLFDFVEVFLLMPMCWLKKLRMSLQSKVDVFAIWVYAWLATFLLKHPVAVVLRERRARSGSFMIGSILGLVLSLYVAGATLADAIINLTNSTKWASAPAAVQTLGTTVLGLVGVVVFIMMLLKSAGIGGD